LLFSPPHTPRYNGSIEAGIGSLKTRTERHATRASHPGYWTCDDVAAAESEANATARPQGETGPMPNELRDRRRRSTAQECGLFQSAVRPGPSTNPMAPHNRTIRELGDALVDLRYIIESGGWRKKEVLIPTIGGIRQGRRPDIIYRTPSGERRGINVGRTRPDGTPVRREVEALSDLNGPGGLPTIFVPY
jgi:hypothetical protein